MAKESIKITLTAHELHVLLAALIDDVVLCACVFTTINRMVETLRAATLVEEPSCDVAKRIGVN